jgi:hypothetical protein
MIGAFDSVLDHSPKAQAHEPMSAPVFQRMEFSLRGSEQHDGLAPYLALDRLLPDFRGFGYHVPTIGIDAGAPDVNI